MLFSFPRRRRSGLALLVLLMLLAKTACAAEPAAEPTFDVFEYVVEGNTVLAAEAIERAVYPFMGDKRRLVDVEAARAALEKAYRDAGYGTVAVDIPEQRVTGGTVVLRVVQAAVSRLRVTGSRYFSQDRIVAGVPDVAEGAVPNLQAVQQQLAAVNRLPDRRVTPLLRPGKEPGTTEVDLAVEDRLPLHGSVELNNKAGPNTSATRLLLALRYDNLFQREHSLGLQVQTSPENTREVRLLSLNYSVPLGLDQLSFSVLRSDSTVPTGSGGATVFGQGTSWGLRRSVVVALEDKAYHALSLGLDYKDFHEVTTSSQPDDSAPVRYMPLSVAYTGIVEDTAGRWQLGTSALVALRNVGSSEAQFAYKRFGASGGFSVLKFDLGREQKLGGGLVLQARVDGQFTGQPLVPNEQFVAGGADSVRGYLESVAVGDIGLRGSVELLSPDFAGITALAFVDGAALQIRQPLPAQRLRERLLGTGVGLRLKDKTYGSLQLMLGVPLKPFGNTDRGDLRLHASGAFDF